MKGIEDCGAEPIECVDRIGLTYIRASTISVGGELVKSEDAAFFANFHGLYIVDGTSKKIEVSKRRRRN
jgi:hypothetical protein